MQNLCQVFFDFILAVHLYFLRVRIFTLHNAIVNNSSLIVLSMRLMSKRLHIPPTEKSEWQDLNLYLYVPKAYHGRQIDKELYPIKLHSEKFCRYVLQATAEQFALVVSVEWIEHPFPIGRRA